MSQHKEPEVAYQLKYGVHGSKQLIAKELIVSYQFDKKLKELNEDTAIKYREAHVLKLIRIDLSTGYETVLKVANYSKQQKRFITR